MDILKAGVIHEHVWKLFDELKTQGNKLQKKEMHEAHKYYQQNAEEYDLPVGEDSFFEGELFDLPLPTKRKMKIKDGKTKTTYMPSLSESWFSGKNITEGKIRNQLNKISKKANIAINKINEGNIELEAKRKELIEAKGDDDKIEGLIGELNIPKVGETRTLTIEDIDAFSGEKDDLKWSLLTAIEEVESKIENMNIVIKVITRLKQAVQLPEQKGATTEQSKLVKKLLQVWGKGGYGEDSKRIISHLDEIGFFKSKKITALQRMLLHGDKEGIPRNIWESFIPRNVRFDKENSEWSDYIEYHKKKSKDIFFEILNRLGISTVLPQQRAGATKKIKEYYGTDLLSNIEKIEDTMKSKKMEDYQYLFDDDMVETNRNIIYKLSNHIMDTYEDAREIKDSLDDSEIEEKTNEINKLINVLEFLYQVMDITANLDIIDDRELTEVIELKGKLSGRTVTIKFDTTKEFPNLQKAFDSAEDIASTQEKERKKKSKNKKQTVKYKTEKARMEAYQKEVKIFFNETEIGYNKEIEELKEQLKSDEKLSPQKKVGIRRSINNREKAIEELKNLDSKYQQRGPINIIMTSKNIIKDLRKLIQFHKKILEEEEEEKVQAELESKVKEIEEIITSFQQLKEKTPNTEDQQEMEGDE